MTQETFKEFLEKDYLPQHQDFGTFLKEEYLPELKKKPLVPETLPPEVKGRIKGLEATQQKQFLNDYMGLIRRVAEGTYRGVAGLTDVLDKGASYISKKFKVPKGHLFEDVNKKARELAEFQRMQGIGGIPGEVASGLGQAAIDIPQFITLGEWGLPIHGALTGLTEEEPVQGAVSGALQGALIHGTLRGIAQLPNKAQLPAFLGFGAATTPGDVKERTTGALTWAALGLTGGRRAGKSPQDLMQDFVDAYPVIKNKITEKRAETILMNANPGATKNAIQKAGGAKRILDESMKLARQKFGKYGIEIDKEAEIVRQQIREKGWETAQTTKEPGWQDVLKDKRFQQIEQKIKEGGQESLTSEEIEYLKKKGVFSEHAMGEMTRTLEKDDFLAIKEAPTDSDLRKIENEPFSDQNIKEMFAGYPVTRELPELAKMVKQVGQLMTDLVYVEPQFNRIGAPETGIAVKSMPSRRNADFEKYERFLKDFNKRFDLTDKDYQDLTFLAYSEKEFDALPLAKKKKFAEPRRLFREYYDNWKSRLQKVGALKEGFPDNAINHMAEERRQKNAMLKRGGIGEKRARELRNEINEINTTIKFLKDSGIKFVHIPRTWLEGLFQKDSTRARKVISEFFHERKTLDMKALANQLQEMGILEPRDLDIRYITGAYTHQASYKEHLAEVFRTGEREGIIDVSGKAPTEWVSLYSREYPSLKGKQVHPALANYIERNLQRHSKVPGKFVRAWTSLMGTTKMLQFYNPIFLPMYDVYQGWWTGSVRSIKTPKLIKNAFQSMKNKDQSYWDMHYWGGFSTPFTPGFDKLLKRVEQTVNSHNILKQAKKYINPYRLSWNAAWTGDHFIRMITYHYYLEKGLSPKESAQLAAKAHADYANIAPKTRTVLNKILFTPSFKLSMMQAQAEMVKNMGKYINPTKTTTATEKEKAKMLVGLASGVALREWMFHVMGFKTDKFGLKYTKEIDTEEGKKQMVLHVATPDNVVLRLLHRFNPTDWATVPDKFQWFSDRAKWELHPMYQWGLEVSANKNLDFEPIYNPFDSPAKISQDILGYTIRRLIPFTTVAFPRKEGNKVETFKRLQKDYGLVAWGLRAFTLPYTRNTEESQIKYRISRFVSAFKKFQREKPPKTEKEAEKRIQAFREKLEKMKEELIEVK